LAIDQVLVGAWRNTSSSWWRWLGMVMQGGDGREQPESFVWRQGKDQIRLSRAGDSWQVSFLTQGRLMGPRQTVYEAIHRQAKFAAWDVMAKVISVSHDEEVGVEVAVQAAQWMRRAEATISQTRA
jgi:hypothetical protein